MTTSKPSPEAPNRAEPEAWELMERSLAALYLEVHESIADDVRAKVRAAIDEAVAAERRWVDQFLTFKMDAAATTDECHEESIRRVRAELRIRARAEPEAREQLTTTAATAAKENEG